MHLSTPVATAAVSPKVVVLLLLIHCPKVVVLLLLIHCFMYLPLCGGVLCLVFVLILICPFKFCKHLDEEDRVGCFDLIIFPVSCEC